MDTADESSDSRWVAIARGFEDFAAWQLLEADGKRLVAIGAETVEELVVRHWGIRRAMFPSLEPDFLDSLRQSVVVPDHSALPHIPHAVGLAAGWISAKSLLEGLRRGSRHPARFERSDEQVRADDLILAYADPFLTELWQQLFLLEQMESSDTVELDGVRGRIRDLAYERLEGWLDLLPWLLCFDGTVQSFTNRLTVEMILERPDLIDKVKRHESHLYEKVGLRARGLAHRIQRAAVGDWQVEIAAVRIDGRRDVFPRPLAEPASTWISDRDLEDLIRGAARQALRKFGPQAVTQGGAEEEGLTQALLTRLEAAFDAVAGMLQLTTGRRATAPLVSLSSRVVPKKEERQLRADVCILVDVQVTDEIRIRFGDLVQVKKSGLFANPKAQQESWRIDIPQLRELLEHSATATYWLIRSDGDVLVVPGKLLLGIVDETAETTARSRTIHYTAVRHSAVSLGSYLCDLMVGMWLGTSDAEKIERFDGTDAQTSPLAIMQVTVRRQPG